ncbi:MAG: ASPIC/UnbV, partial [Chthonomonadales bacterium]|nr:ASPIC/UnbV [Chthonomonadales bacterium]
MKRKALFETGLCMALVGLLAFSGCNHSAGPGGVTPVVNPSSGPQAVLNFVDITAKAGIDWKRANGAFGKKWFPETAGGGGAFIDYDNDGYPDIVLINGDWWPGHTFSGSRPQLALYHNNQNGTFTDVTAKMGLALSLQGMGIAVGDYDNDGYDDLYITALGGNHLLHNEGGKGFKDVSTQAGVSDSGWSTSAAWVDIDHDGKLDLFVCHYVKWTPATDIFCGGQTKAYCTPVSYPGESNRLYHNDGNGRFTDTTRKAGLWNDSGKALGICTVDYDHDGSIDLLVANDGEPNLAYHNRGNGTFEDVSAASGLALGEDGKPRNGMGIDASDYQNSGKLGVLVGNFSFQGVGLHREQAGGIFLDAAREAGLAQPSYPYVTFGVMFCDVDNDGWPDALITNGHVDDTIEKTSPVQHYLQPTQIFLNRHDGTFADTTGKAG